MPAAQTAVEKFLIMTATGPVRAVKCGLSRKVLERLVAAGVAKRIETVGTGRTFRRGDAPAHVPSMVRYDRA